MPKLTLYAVGVSLSTLLLFVALQFAGQHLPAWLWAVVVLTAAVAAWLAVLEVARPTAPQVRRQT